MKNTNNTLINIVKKQLLGLNIVNQLSVSNLLAGKHTAFAQRHIIKNRWFLRSAQRLSLRHRHNSERDFPVACLLFGKDSRLAFRFGATKDATPTAVTSFTVYSSSFSLSLLRTALPCCSALRFGGYQRATPFGVIPAQNVAEPGYPLLRTSKPVKTLKSPKPFNSNHVFR
jgi:hypothetical protein